MIDEEESMHDSLSQSPAPRDLSEEELRHFRSRVEENFYDDPWVIAKIAGRLIGSGDLASDSPSVGS